MIRVRCGTVVSILEENDHVQHLSVATDAGECEAVSFVTMVGPASPGDTVVLNTTAAALQLGTGGHHFVMAIEGRERDIHGAGHIIKVRYTPSQLRVLAVEEEASPHHETLKSPGQLHGLPVAVATLHSLIAPFAVAFKEGVPGGRLAYVMTDGAALPAQISRLARQLRREGWLDVIITCGHAFGGDLEAVTVYSALQAAREVAECEACIVAMGPGVVGTGTPLGTSALEQAPILDGAGALGANALAVPRLSFADRRDRHHGLSHHSRTSLGRLAQRAAVVVLPTLPPHQRHLILAQCKESQITPKHQLLWEDVGDIAERLSRAGIQVTSMGRTPAQDPAFFAAGAAAGAVAARLCRKKE